MTVSERLDRVELIAIESLALQLFLADLDAKGPHPPEFVPRWQNVSPELQAHWRGIARQLVA